MALSFTAEKKSVPHAKRGTPYSGSMYREIMIRMFVDVFGVRADEGDGIAVTEVDDSVATHLGDV